MKRMMSLLVVVASVLLASCAASTPLEVEPPVSVTPVAEDGTAVPTPTTTQPYPAQDPGGVPDVAYPVEVDLSRITPQPGDGTPQEMPQPGVPGGLSSISQLVSRELAQRLGKEMSDITVISQQAVEWSDGALGCPGPNMAYIQVIIPGFKIVLQADGRTYNYHTDTGSSFVLCGPNGQPVP